MAFVSIHAARVGRDADVRADSRLARVSIHAARVGRDLAAGHTHAQGAASIHAARVGRDRDLLRPNGAGMFRSTRPAWAATLVQCHARLLVQVSIHAARVGRDGTAEYY